MSTELSPIYIMGRGHSGSTVTDAILGNASEIESVGELMSGLNRGLVEDCSCGRKLAECEYWTSVSQIYRERYGEDLYQHGAEIWQQSDVRRFFSAFFADFAVESSSWSRHAKINQQVISAIAEYCGKGSVLDSNKEYTRAVVYLKCFPRAKVIHLFRKPSSVVGSHYYRLNKGFPFKIFKKEYYPGRANVGIIVLLSLGWSLGMLLACVIKARYPNRVLHVSYEKLCANPEREMKRIGHFLDLNLSSLIQSIANDETFPVGHNIGGNEQRHEGGYRFIRNVKGRRVLPLLYRYLVNLLVLPATLIRLALVRA